MSTHEAPAPDTAALARWMRTWIGAQGQIRGFHNHSVWGTNPATFIDFTSGHQAFSAPATAAFAQALARRPDDRAREMWRRMMLFQARTVQGDGQFRHIGFQVGESATSGLIHNMAGCIGLLEGLRHAGHLLEPGEAEEVLRAVRANLEACRVYGGGRPSEDGTVNQEYARVWAKFRYTELSGDDRYAHELEDDLDALVRLSRAPGVPDAASCGAYRQPADRAEGGILEPAEYYGLMIVPLVIGSRRFARPDLLDEAVRLSLHVARSAWTDERGRTRFHRYWYVRGETALKTTEPMLIAGMGLSLYGIDEVLSETEHPELAAFVEDCLATYAAYQTPAGYFASATGWHNEADVAPSTAWHAHDLLFLVRHYDTAESFWAESFWDVVFAEPERRSVLLSDRAYWVEDGVHWCILSPLTAGDLSIYGRKDRDDFARSFFAWTDKEPLPAELAFDEAPVFFVADEGIWRLDDSARATDVSVLGAIPYRGHVREADRTLDHDLAHVVCITSSRPPGGGDSDQGWETTMSTPLRRRTRGAVILGFAPVLALTACGSGGGSDSDSVRMLVNITDNLTQEKWEALVKPFEDETGIDVEIEGPTGQSVAESFPSLLAAGTAPDVIQSIFPSEDTAPEILDLTEYEWASGTPMADLYATDGEINVVGVGMQPQSLLYYNADLFEQAGVTEPPQTWDELDAALAALDGAGVATPIAFASEWATGVQAQQIWHPQQNVAAPGWQQSVADGSSSLGEQFEPLFEHLSEWIDAGYTTADDVATDSGTQEANFIAGEVGIYPMGSWFTTTLAASPPDFEVGVFSAPVDAAADAPGPMGATMAYPYMVWNGTEKVDDATALVEYLVTDAEAIATQAEMDHFTREGLDTSGNEYASAVQEVADQAPSFVVPGNQTVGDYALPVAGFNPKFTELVQSLWQGADPADVAADLTAWYEAESAG
ncbi:ABC transporter substrate-binding protein [Glycomyces tenuis]|uniref:ABC transporter substrate-binding protein n=1 Tax=Glycomyces tenuis TaxID=58116 RepID=UPI00040D7EAB|nr:extracellular solute-binding protein [Glycomyces tenuis]